MLRDSGSGSGHPAEPSSREAVTLLLRRAAEGEPAAVDGLLGAVYGELRAMAAAYLGRERTDHTLQPTALVHEAYLKLVDQTRADLRDSAHFLAVAAQAMRRILVDHARIKQAEKRGGGRERVDLATDLLPAAGEALDVLAVDRGLERLRRLSERQARIVELRFFGGMEQKDVARVLDVSLSTVEREWRVARAFLYGFLSEEP